MFRRFLLLTAVLPFVELALLVWIASHTSAMFAMMLILVPTACGLALTRYQGLWAWRQVQARVQQGEAPASALLDGLMIWIAGILLIIPGVLTDLVGLLLLIPPLRRLLRDYIQRRIRARLHVVSPSFDAHRPTGDATDHDRIIDVRVIGVDSEEAQPKQEK